MSVEGSLSSEETHTSLSLVLFKAKNIEHPSADLLNMISKELFETLTIRSLLRLCTACKLQPTAPMLAIALQNSIPSLTGLPMDNPDTGYYIEIAKRFFAPMSTSIPVSYKIAVRKCLEPGVWLHLESFRNNDIEAPVGFFPSGVSFYVNLMIPINYHFLDTKEGREFVKCIALEWLQTPLDPRMVKIYNHLINVMDHGLVLRWRRLTAGWLERPYTHRDEHL